MAKFSAMYGSFGAARGYGVIHMPRGLRPEVEDVENWEVADRRAGWSRRDIG